MGRRVRRIVTSRQLRACASEWMHTLGLSDWTVSLQFARRASSPLDGDYGACQALIERKTARILIARPSECDTEDVETILVHELLHLFFAALPARSAELQRLTEEQAVDRLATVLVALRR